MAFSSLNKTEKETVHQCLKVILNGSYIDDWEFSTRLGFDRESLKQVLSLRPQLDDSEDGLIRLAINNCMNEVCHGIDISPAEWKSWFTVSREEAKATYFKWAKLAGYLSSGIQ